MTRVILSRHSFHFIRFSMMRRLLVSGKAISLCNALNLCTRDKQMIKSTGPLTEQTERILCVLVLYVMNELVLVDQKWNCA